MKPYLAVRGFTLIEMAVVVVIVGLMLGGLLMPLTAQMDQRDYSKTKDDIDTIKNALIGYAMSHSLATDGKPYLPCPDTDGDGIENRNVSACTNQEGDIPWADLGMPRIDSWGRTYRYHVTAAFSNNATGFTLTSNGDINVRQASGGALLASAVPVVILSRGKNGADSGTDEADNGNGNQEFVSHAPSDASGNQFDDIVDWIPSTILINLMVTTGRLP